MRRVRNALISSLLTCIVCAFAETGCQSVPGRPSGAPTPLAAVSAVPFPSMPPMVRDVSPQNEADARTQIRVRFVRDLVPIASLDAADGARALEHFRIAPAIAGRFRILTPQMVGFQADAPLPLASQFVVTVTAGLTDTTGAKLASDLAWSFTTSALVFDEQQPRANDAEQTTQSALDPDLHIGANLPFDVASLTEHVALVAGGARIRLVPKSDPSPSTAQSASPVARPTPAEGDAPPEPMTVTLHPEHPLARNTRYTLALDAGVAPRDGNLASSTARNGVVQTYVPLALAAIAGFGAPSDDDPSAVGRFVSGTPQLQFTTPVTIASALRAIHISPAPLGGRALFAGTGASETIALDPNALAPATTYAITVEPTLTDIFGQRLAERATRTFAVGHLASDLWAPSGFAIFRASDDVTLRASATNLPGGRYRAFSRAVSPTDLIAGESTDPDLRTGGLLPEVGSWNEGTVQAAADRPSAIDLPLGRVLGAPTGLLAYGFAYRRPGAARPIAITGLVQKTDLGVFAQWFPQRGVVRVARLTGGAPVAGANVTIYPSLVSDRTKAPNGSPDACARGTTDATGTVEFLGAAFASCELANDGDRSAPALLAVARDGSDWAYARTEAYSNAWQSGGDATWTNGSPLERGALFSDRSLYQPGESLELTGISYFLHNGILGRGRSATYALELVGPSGATIALGDATVDAFGAFSKHFVLARTAELGTYQIAAKGAGETLTGNLRVAEFKPPNFAVKLALDATAVRAGARVAAATTSTYLFGGAVAGGSTRTFATRGAASYAPAGYDDYTFGRAYFYPEQQPAIDPNVLETRAAIGSDGVVRQAIDVPADLPFPMTYSVDAETIDASQLTVGDHAEFTAFPSDAIIGIKSRYVGTARTATPIDAIVLGIDGKPKAGRAFRVALERATYSTSTHATDGVDDTRQRVAYAEVAHVDATSDRTASHLTLVPPSPGTYRIRATFPGSDERSATDAQIWVAGDGAGNFAIDDGAAIPVKLDRATYRVGDTVRALVTLPYANADVTLTVLAGDVLVTQRLHARGTSAAFAFGVTQAMLPNAAVQAFVVRRGAVRAGDRAAETKRLAGVGFASFHVDLAAKHLRLALEPRDAIAHPGAIQHLHVHLTDLARQPVNGAVVVAVVDEAILQLSGYRFPDLVATVYADRPIAQRYADNRASVQLVAPQRYREKGWGYGGGLSAAAAGTRVRAKFAPLAYYRGDVRTDANGDADIAFSLPDTLTTWRALAVGLTRDARFATADATFRSTTALTTNALLPQFARIGDRFDGGVLVTSPSNVGKTIAVTATVRGGAAFLAGTSEATHTETNATLATATQAVRLPVIVMSAVSPAFTFASTLAGVRDALVADLPIRTHDVTENVVVTGHATRATTPIAIAPTDADPTIDVTVSTNIVGDLRAPLRAILDDDAGYGDAVASRLSALADLASLRKYDPTLLAPLDIAKRVTIELHALAQLARASGGYGLFRDDRQHSPWLDAYVTTALARLHDAGYPVASELSFAMRAVRRALADPTRDGSCAKGEAACRNSVRVVALAALAAAGETRSDFLGELIDARNELTVVGKYALARHLVRIPAFAQARATLTHELAEKSYLTADNSTVGTQLYESHATAQAAAIELAVVTRATTADGLVRQLLAKRSNGQWGCTCDNAIALAALTDYVRAQPPPREATVRVSLGSGARTVRLTTGKPTATLHFANAAVRSASAIEIDADASVAYAIDYGYRLTGDVPGRYAGLRVDRELRLANTSAIVATMGLGPITKPSLAIGHIYDVTVRVTADHAVDAVAIEDPLPAGMEAVDTTFATATQAYAPLAGSWAIAGRTIARDRIGAFANHLEPGSYELHYLARTVTPGTFAWPGAEARLRFSANTFGRSAQTTLDVTP